MTKQTSFTDNQDRTHSVEFVETTQIKDGVSCDAYKFTEDTSRDLAIVKVDPGKSIPLMRVLKGKKTIEGFVKGKGKLVVTSEDGNTKSYEFDHGDKSEVEIKIGDVVQWTADEEQPLVFYEICDPPYEDGRYQHLDG